jgi:HD superfamily phosphohydrolase
MALEGNSKKRASRAVQQPRLGETSEPLVQNASVIGPAGTPGVPAASQEADAQEDGAGSRPEAMDPDQAAARTQDEEPAAVDPRLKPHKTFLDPVQGDVKLTRLETQIVNTPEFQRLGRIRQLGGAHYVFRGATHTRFDHCIGTVAVAERIVQAINNNPRREAPGRRTMGIGTTAHVVVRLVALLHDITHVPFSHTLEDEIGLYARHDAPKRFTERLGSETTIGRLIAEAEGPQVLEDVVATLRAKGDEEIRGLRFPFAADIVANTLCADLVDYLRRDCYFTGLRDDFRERFLEYLFIPVTGPVAGRVVVRLNKKDTDAEIRSDQITDIMSLLRLRYRLAERVYYHHTKIKFGAMIGRAVLEVDEFLDRDKLYDFGDDKLIEYLAEQPEGPLTASKLAWRKLGLALRDRRMYALAFTYRGATADPVRRQLADEFNEFKDPLAQREKTEDESDAPMPNRARYREWVRELERRVGLEPGELVFYCPKLDMQRKLAMALVAYGPDENVVRLGEIEEEAETLLQNEHRRLWRFEIFMHPDYASADPKIASETQISIDREFKKMWSERFRNMPPILNQLSVVTAQALAAPDDWGLRAGTYRRRWEHRSGQEPLTDVEQEKVIAGMRSARGGSFPHDSGELPRYEDYEVMIERVVRPKRGTAP